MSYQVHGFDCKSLAGGTAAECDCWISKQDDRARQFMQQLRKQTVPDAATPPPPVPQEGARAALEVIDKAFAWGIKASAHPDAQQAVQALIQVRAILQPAAATVAMEPNFTLDDAWGGLLESETGERLFKRFKEMKNHDLGYQDLFKDFFTEGFSSGVASIPGPAPAREAESAPGNWAFDLVSHLVRQIRFSQTTFGPGARSKGVVDHIRKELAEIEAAPADLKEWIDVIILGFDGAWRSFQNSGDEPKGDADREVIARQIAAALQGKQSKNEARKWPDWRTMSPDKAIEHDRSDEKRECYGCRFSGFDIADGPYCAHPKVLEKSPAGVSLSSIAIVEFCAAPAHPLWERKVEAPESGEAT